MKNIYLIKSDSYFLLNNKISELTEGIEDITKIDLDNTEKTTSTPIDIIAKYNFKNRSKMRKNSHF